MNFFRNRVIADVINQVKTRTRGWVVIHHDWWPHIKGKFGRRDAHTGRTPCEEEMEAACARAGNAGVAGKASKPGSGPEQMLPHRFWKESPLPTP